MKCGISSHSWQKWCTMLGLFILQWPLDVQLYWSNLAIYTTSYEVMYVDPQADLMRAPWVVSLSETGGTFGVFLVALLNRWLCKKMTMACVLVLCNAGLVSAYFATRTSPALLEVLLGIVVSTGRGGTLAVSACYAVEWSENDLGLLTAIIFSAHTIGTIFMNQLITFYTNPGNLKPDKIHGASRIFTQPEVLDRVPSMFLILATVVMSTSVVGLLMLRENKNYSNIVTNNDDVNTTTTTKKRNYGGTLSDKSVTSSNSLTKNDEVVNIDFVSEKEQNCSSQTSKSNKLMNFKWMGLFCNRSIHIYWTILVLGEFTFMTLNHYYKIYGQLYIRDDHFLTTMSSTIMLSICLSNWLWGVLMDRWTLKTSFVIFFASSAITSFAFYFSPIVNRWCYVVMTSLFGASASPIHIFISVGCLRTFGPSDYLVYYGVASVPCLVINLILPIIFDVILLNWGWFYLYAVGACCNLAGLVFVILTLPDTSKGEHSH